MAQLTWAGGRAIILAVTALFLLPLQAQAERDWEFSVGAFGGKALHSNESMKSTQLPDASGGTDYNVTAHGVNLNCLLQLVKTFGRRSSHGGDIPP